MKIKQLFFGLAISLNIAAYAQESKKEVLFTIDNKPYYTDEFTRVYNKNLDLVKDESQKDINHYLDLFIAYKLKINKANKLSLQNDPQYQAELASYRTQLSKDYVTDTKVTRELIEEGYNRSLKEIKAAHILILVDENAAPADTLKAFKEISDLRKRAVNGEKFEDLAVKYSQDPSAKDNKGELGYFSAFRMVYPFESAAYKTQKDGISQPVRTRFGYHIIKVEDIRDNRGEVTVSHIMIMKPANNPTTTAEKAKSTIDDIYQKLNQGEKFEDLARQFSEDRSSAPEGGLLSRFGSGQLSSEEFEQVAFGLTVPNSYSKPFESQFGWHIVKLIEKHPVKTLEEAEKDLENKVRKDDRSRLITNSLNETLRKKYKVVTNPGMYAKISKAITDSFYGDEWKMPGDPAEYAKPLVTIQDKQINGTAFVAFLKNEQIAKSTVKPVSKLIGQLYDKFVDQQLNSYYNENLENEYPEFNAVMEEYRDGLLLFELMEKEIWEKAKTDTIGLANFYKEHAANYQWKTREDVIIASSTDEAVIKKARKLLKQNKTAEFIKKELDATDKVNVMINSGVFEEGNHALPKNLKPKTGVSDIVKEGEYYFVAKINKILPAGPKTLEETRGKVINDYQQFLEENWVGDLKKEATIQVERPVFERVKQTMQSKK